MLSGKMLGEAGMRVVLEEFLQGEELSFLVMSDGERGVPLVAAQDHKRVGDNDTGPNTGGMGAYSTDKIVDPQMANGCSRTSPVPSSQGMKEEGMEFKGILYCGLMMTAKGPMVLEFNCRFGDPETQAILMRLESDLVDAFESSVQRPHQRRRFQWCPDAAVTVVMASGGYPGSYEAGKRIHGLNEAGESRRKGFPRRNHQARRRVLHRRRPRTQRLRPRRHLARRGQLAYDAIMKIRFDGMIYRKDIASRGLKAAI